VYECVSSILLLTADFQSSLVHEESWSFFSREFTCDSALPTLI